MGFGTFDLYDDREAQEAGARETQLFARLRSLLARAKAEQPYWAERLADVDPDAIGSRSALASLPVLRKSDLPAMHKANPPFGGLNASKTADLARLFISPGPIFDMEGRGDDWGAAARALHAAGVRRGDIVLNTFSYHMTPAGLLFDAGARALGCPVIPAGPGNTADQVVLIEHLRPTAYVGTPDFLKILLDKAAEGGRDASSIRCGLVSGAALPASLASELTERGIGVRQCYATADLGIVAYEADGPGMVLNEDLILEIIRPGTGVPLPNGEVGEVLVTRLNDDYPLFRFATGDMSSVIAGTSASPHTNVRIRGWLGRADQATKVKGMFVRPEQVAAIAAAVPGVRRLRLVVRRSGEQDLMLLRAEHTDETAKVQLARKLEEITRLKGEVEVVAPGSLPNDGKVIADERNYA
jgi:phenylacetate-CoA ligase